MEEKTKSANNNEISNAETAFELVNKYGTYEIQPTADTENQYPAIAQGFNEKIIKRDCQRLSHGEEW